MTKYDPSVPVFRSVHFYIGFFILKEPICSPLKFKMANSRHIENRFLAVFFCFPTAFWTSTSGGFRIISDTLVIRSIPSGCCFSFNGILNGQSVVNETLSCRRPTDY